MFIEFINKKIKIKLKLFLESPFSWHGHFMMFYFGAKNFEKFS